MPRAAVVLLLVLAGALASAGTASARPTYVSLTFDDGSASEYQVRSALSSHGMHGTFYINSGLVGQDSYYMDWSQVADLAADGNEIGGHTSTHPDLTTLTTAQQTTEICGDRSALQARGYNPVSFAYPFAKWNTSARSVAASCGYTSARGVGNVGCLPGCAPAESIPPVDPYVLRTANGITNTTSVGTMEGYVSNAVANGGGWVILVFHTICDGCSDTNSTTLTKLGQLLDWLSSQSTNGVQVLTVKDAMALPAPPEPPNLLQNGGLESLTSVGPIGWTRAPYAGSTGAGNVATWASTSDAHGGASAEQVTISSYADGDQKLISNQDLVAAVPAIGSATATTTGALSGKYYYQVTSTTAAGETPASAEVSVTTSGGATITWGNAKGATGYRVYRSTAAGQETLLASVGAVTSFTDNGSQTPGTATPPTVNSAVRGTPVAPPAVPGHVYLIRGWYKSSATANLRMVVYYRDTLGNWVFWREQPIPASQAWSKIAWQTPAAPAAATALSTGFSLRSAGSATFDDIALGDLMAP